MEFDGSTKTGGASARRDQSEQALESRTVCEEFR